MSGTAYKTLPSGTVTFLFTDLEGSVRLWEQHDDAMPPAAVRRHDELLHTAIAAHRGVVFSPMGDGMGPAAFSSAHTPSMLRSRLSVYSRPSRGVLSVRYRHAWACTQATWRPRRGSISTGL